MEEVVQEGRGTALELAVAEELRQPAHDVDDNGGLGGGDRVGNAEVVGEGTRGEADERQRGAGDRFEEDVEPAPCQGREGAQVWFEVGDLEKGGEGEEWSIVGSLGSFGV